MSLEPLQQELLVSFLVPSISPDAVRKYHQSPLKCTSLLVLEELGNVVGNGYLRKLGQA